MSESNMNTPPVNDHIDPRENQPSIITSFFNLSEKLSSSRYLRWVVIALLPLLILLRYPVAQGDYDVWWQMALGKYYLTHHTIVIDHSIFSWTPADPGWIYNTFLGSIIIYLAYSLMGSFGLWLFQWFIFLGVFLAFYLFLRLIHQRLDVTSVTIIAAIGIACSLSCSYYKPELFSTLLLCWVGFIFAYVKLTHRKVYFYLYPLVFALLVNLHGAFIMGLWLIACFFIGELLNKAFFPRESFTIKELIHLGTACFLSLIVTLLNPYGIDYLLSIYNAATSSITNINIKYILAYVSLWPFLTGINISLFREGQNAWILSLMMFSLICLFLYDIIKKKSCDFTLLIINAFYYWGSMKVARGTYAFPIIFFFSFFYMLHRLKLKNITGKATILSLLVFIFFFVNISYYTFRYNTDNKWFGTGIESFAPVQEVAFLKKYRLEGPIFNDYFIGGYLLWDLYPDYKVFIDPRLGPFGKQVAPDYWSFTSIPATSEDIKRFTKKYPFRIAIIHYRELPLIFDFLNSGWQLLYFEKNAAILIHKSLLPSIPPEVATVDLGPLRFSDVKNSEVLLNLFTLYINVNPESARIIYDIYKKNISDYYKPKTESLQMMEEDIRKKERESPSQPQ